MENKLFVFLKHVPAHLHHEYAAHLKAGNRKHTSQIAKLYHLLANNNFEYAETKELSRKVKTTNLPSLMTKLLRDLEGFCIDSLYGNCAEADMPELWRVKFYGEIRMWSVYKVLRKRFVKFATESDICFAEDTYMLYRFFKLDAINAKYSVGRNDNEEILLPLKYLNLFYQFEEMKMLIEQAFRNDILEANYSSTQMQSPNNALSPPVKLLMNIYRVIQDDYKSLLIDYPIISQQFNDLNFSAHRHAESIKTLAHFLMNLCIKGINRGYIEFCSEYIRIVDFLIAHQLLLEKGKVEVSIFKNALAAATKTGNVGWAMHFSEKFIKFLDVAYGNELRDYYMATLAFNNGDWNSAEELLPYKITNWYNEPFLQLSIMRLRTKLIIEKYGLDNWDELDAQLRQMRNFLKKAGIGKETKLKHLGFVLVMEKIMCHKIKDLDEIKNKEAILDREWLLEQFERFSKLSTRDVKHN